MSVPARTLVLALTASLLAPACSAKAAPNKEVDLRTRYETGRTYRTTEKSLIERSMGGQKRFERTTTVTDRLVVKGGVVGVDEVVLKDRVVRMQVTAYDGRRETTYDSDDGPPKTEEQAAMAILAGASYTLTVKPSGEVVVSELVRNLAPLEKYDWDADLMEMLKAATSETALAAQMKAYLDTVPSKPVKPGATWESAATLASGPKVAFKWKLAKLKGRQAVVKASAKLPAKVSGHRISGKPAKAEMVYDVAKRLPVRVESNTAFTMNVGKRRFGVRYEVEIVTELLDASAAPRPEKAP